MISFQANYITSGIVKKRTLDNKYQNQDVAFVEFDLNSYSDKRTMKKISKAWSKEFNKLEKQGEKLSGETCFAKTIWDYFKISCRKPDLRSYYAITTQTDNFEKLNPDEVLGLARVTNEGLGIYELEHLQVKPEHTAFIKNPEYKRIGSGVLDCLLLSLPFREFKVVPTFAAAEFYAKYGFQFDPDTLGFCIKA